MMDRLLQFSYAASVAFSQALMTFAQIRADQEALAKMTALEIKAMVQPAQAKAPIGFNKSSDAS